MCRWRSVVWGCQIRQHEQTDSPKAGAWRMRSGASGRKHSTIPLGNRWRELSYHRTWGWVPKEQLKWTPYWGSLGKLDWLGLEWEWASLDPKVFLEGVNGERWDFFDDWLHSPWSKNLYIGCIWWADGWYKSQVHKCEVEENGGGGWEGKVQADAFRLLYVSTWPMFCGPEYGQTGMFQTQISGPYRGLNVNNGVELFSGPWNGSWITLLLIWHVQCRIGKFVISYMYWFFI